MRSVPNTQVSITRIKIKMLQLNELKNAVVKNFLILTIRADIKK